MAEMTTTPEATARPAPHPRPHATFRSNFAATLRETAAEHPRDGIGLTGKMALRVWRNSLDVLDRLRAFPTMRTQVLAMQLAVEMAPTVIAAIPTEERPVFKWIKGGQAFFDAGADVSAFETMPVFYIPNYDWLELLLIAYGDRRAVRSYRRDAIRNDGRGAVRYAREMVTLVGMEHHLGPQPNYRRLGKEFFVKE